MIGIDTNIVLRYLLKDDPALSPRALEIMARKLRTAPPVEFAVK